MGVYSIVLTAVIVPYAAVIVPILKIFFATHSVCFTRTTVYISPVSFLTHVQLPFGLQCISKEGIAAASERSFDTFSLGCAKTFRVESTTA